MKKRFLLVLSMIPFFTACDLGFFDGGGGEDNPPVPPVVTPDPTVFDDEDKLYEAFFNPKSKVDITLEFTNKAIYSLARYGESSFTYQEMYHPCKVTISINNASKTYESVGARMKGNTSRNQSFVNEQGYFDKGSSRWCHMKLSFAETFQKDKNNDYYHETFENDDAIEARKDRKFGGMKKFDIKWNKNYDNTFTRECYANYCLRDVGLPAGQVSLATVTVKSEVDSFTDQFNIMECIDKQMLKRYFSKAAAKGDLYKCGWPVDFAETSDEWIGEEAEGYSPKYDIKTNEDETDHSTLKNFLSVINNGSSTKAQLDEVVDMDLWIKYCAIMWVIGNPDDLRNNTNNTYIYFNAETNKMVVIPYDNDRCFGILKDWPIDTSTVWATTTKRCGADRAWNENKLIWRTIIHETDANARYSEYYPVISEYESQYLKLCKEYANKYLKVNSFKEYNNSFYYSKKDIENGGAENMSFADYSKNKLETLKNI